METAVKYIIDQEGRKKEVIVPIEVWEHLTKKKQTPFKLTKEKLASYEGILSQNIDPVEFQRKIRDEWE